jgi:flagellar motility protein MotE (MotC chaperone)
LAGRFGPTPSLRLLPIVILAAVGMLGFKLQVVVKEVAGETRLVAFVMEQSAAFAQAAAPNAAKPAAPAAPAATPPAAAAAAPGTAPTPPAADGAAPPAEGAAPADAAAAAAEASGPASMLNFDPANLTKAEVDTLQRLAERREVIERRERETNAKEGLLKAAESRIDGKIAQLQDLEKNIQGLLKQYDGQKQEEIDQLVRIYSAMKPKDAASIFETLEMPILVGVVQKMNVAKVAPILGAMAQTASGRTRATLLTEELTARKQLSAVDPAAPTPAAARAPAAPAGAAAPRAN